MEDPQKVNGRTRSRIAGNAFSLAVCGAAGMLFTLLQLGVLSRNLDGGVFGMFVALRGLSLLLSTLMLLGMPQVLIRFLPSYNNRGQRGKTLRLFSTATVAVTIAGLAILASIDLWKELIPSGLAAAPGRDVLFWMTLSSIPLALKLLLYGAFNGQRVMHLQMIYEMGYLLLMTAAIVVMRVRLDIVLLFRLSFVFNCAVFAGGLPAFLAYLLKEKGGDTGPAMDGVITPSFTSYLGNSILLSLVALAFTDFDRFVMSSALPLTAISVFHIASRINSLLKRFLGFPVVALQPEITRIYEEGRWEDLRERIVLFTKTTLVCSFLFASLAAIGGKDAIKLISGEDFLPAYGILVIMLPCVPIAALIAPLLSAMKGLHFMRWAVLSDLTWMSVYFGSFFFLVSLMGVRGMAFAQLCASVVQMAVVVALSRKSGFYGGAGKRTGRVLASFIVYTAVGVALRWRFGFPASAVLLLGSPFFLREVLVRFKVFDSGESGMIKNMIGFRTGRKLVAWAIGSGRTV